MRAPKWSLITRVAMKAVLVTLALSLPACGKSGSRGDDGAQGVPGTPGQAGADGKQGPTGKTGPQGETGPSGPKGPAGPAGKDGGPGLDGKNGRDGLNGQDGLSGRDGKDGKDGQAGLKAALATQISTSGRHTCALLWDGKVACWGSNAFGQLGTEVYDWKPVIVSELTTAIQVGTGRDFSCALKRQPFANDKHVFCWGDNSEGALGVPVSSVKKSHVPILAATYVDQLAVGHRHVCVLRSFERTVECWGDNSVGQLATDVALAPGEHSKVKIDLGEAPLSTLVRGPFNTCVLNKDGRAACWGQNSHQQIAANQGTIAKPTELKTLPGPIEQLTQATEHSCALLKTGEVYCWGSNEDGLLGVPHCEGRCSLPQEVTSLRSQLRAIVANSHGTCGQTISRELYCWGLFAVGVPTLLLAGPQPVPELADVDSFALGDGNVCFIKSGLVSCLGTNNYGEAGSEPPSDVPIGFPMGVAIWE